MRKNDLISHLEKTVSVVLKYRYAAAILTVGIVLMLFPYNRTERQKTKKFNEGEIDVVKELESRMEALLRRVDGAGDVSVLLSVDTSMLHVYQENVSLGSRNEDKERDTETVVLRVDGNDTALQTQMVYPQYRGAVVVAEGADRPSVQLKLLQATASLTGLKMDQITVFKMKSD